MSGKPERWEIEADAAYARGVDAGLRAWHGNWSPEEVRRVMERNERLKLDVVEARAARIFPSPSNEDR